MLRELATTTNAIAWLMAGIGVLGVLAKIINQFTLHRLLKAASNMTKSTHRLIKLVRAKYEHACMIHDSVENIDAFVEKYIYEYRGFLFRIHTWRQIEILSIWFAGILAALGASANYLSSGFTESVYQYIAGGAAEVVLLFVVSRLSDEPYKVRAVKMYMVDYLDNICAFRLRKQRSAERESIDVIAPESYAKTVYQNAGQTPQSQSQGNMQGAAVQASAAMQRGEQPGSRPGMQPDMADVQMSMQTGNEAGMQQSGVRENFQTPARQSGIQTGVQTGVQSGAQADQRAARSGASRDYQPAGPANVQVSPRDEDYARGENAGNGSARADQVRKSDGRDSGRKGIFRKNQQRAESKLPINIEGEPKNVVGEDAIRQVMQQVSAEQNSDDRPALREEAIRQILEEFLA